MHFELNDMVVVSGCGVGRIEAVETLDLGDAPVEVYRIQLDEDAGRVWIPVDRVDNEGVRPVMTEDVVEQAWEVIRAQEAPEKRANWNRRQRRYREQVMQNSPRALAELLGELAAVRRHKPLSFTERKLFDQAKDMLVAEIAAAMGKARAVVEQQMHAALRVA